MPNANDGNVNVVSRNKTNGVSLITGELEYMN